jgi:hypothetical protein
MVGSNDADGRLITHMPLLAGRMGEQATSGEVSVVLDTREGSTVYVRPARRDEESSGVHLQDGETAVLRMEASHFCFEGEAELVRVVPEGGEGSSVFYRRLDPGEIDTGETVKWVPSEDELVPVTRKSYVGMHLTSEVGQTEDLLTAMRLVPDGREGSTVYGRTLRWDEEDTGEAVILKPGDHFVFRPGALSTSVEGIDAYGAVAREDGYAPITNTLWTWFSIGGGEPPEGVRFILAAARRLDASHRTLETVREGLSSLDEGNVGGIRARDLLYDIIGAVESTVVPMYRAVKMASQLEERFAVSTPFPNTVAEKLPKLKAIRDAYEHIEDRARGLVHGKPHPDALSVFEFEPLFRDHVVAYADYALDLDAEVTQLFVEVREYLKIAAGELRKASHTAE